MADPEPDLPPVERFDVHRVLVDHLRLAESDMLLDLGCGTGGILIEAAERVPGVGLVGVDRDPESLAAASAWLGRMGARYELVEADLGKSLTLPGPPVHKLVCHNVLECLPDPQGAVDSAVELMAPGATSIWSHTDFDSLVIHGADPVVTRRVVHGYADLTEAGMDCSDGQMGRKVPTLVSRSPLELVGVESHVAVSTRLAGGARSRINRIVAALYDESYKGSVDVTPDELDSWVDELLQADQRGEFLYSQTTFITIAEKPVEAAAT